MFKSIYPLIAIPKLAMVPEMPKNHCSSKIKKIPETDPIMPITKASFEPFFFVFIHYFRLSKIEINI